MLALRFLTLSKGQVIRSCISAGMMRRRFAVGPVDACPRRLNGSTRRALGGMQNLGVSRGYRAWAEQAAARRSALARAVSALAAQQAEREAAVAALEGRQRTLEWPPL